MGGDTKERDSLRQLSHIAEGRWQGEMERVDGRSSVAEERHGVMDVDRLLGLVVVIRGHCPAPYPRNKAFQITTIHGVPLSFEPSQADAEYPSGLMLLQDVSLHS